MRRAIRGAQWRNLFFFGVLMLSVPFAAQHGVGESMQCGGESVCEDGSERERETVAVT